MAGRLLILLCVAAGFALVWGCFRAWQSHRLRRLRSKTPLSELVPPGLPAVVAFSAPRCRDCRTLQAPALARLRDSLHGQIQVTSVSALDYPDLVAQLGILTVPSTVVLDARGTVQKINLGYTSDSQLREQLSAPLGGA